MAQESIPAEISDKQKAQQNLEFLQKEYWRLRNNTQRYMRCPYCTEDHRMRNFPGSPQFCCKMFAKAFKAILDRQEEIDKAWAGAQVMKSAMKATVN
jgi:hypothetical protein